tara:strand:- start:550 stop:1380 length:831 start_codon:yes stop_codon:yes gene_type:complete
MYNDCPLRWKLNYVDDLRISESNIHLIFGTAMHEVLQEYLENMYYSSIKNADVLNLEEMLRDKLVEQFKLAEESDGKAPCTKEDLQEFFQDGCDIIDFFRKRRADYFQKRQYELIGCEVPIDVDLKNNVKIVGYLDVVLKHIPTDTITIIDIKTSTRGWNKWMKADKNKTQQLLLYKNFYSEQYNHPMDKIDVEYFIVKRKLWENTDFPQKRVQKFVPANGKPSINKVINGLNLFLENSFSENGEYKTDKIFANPSKKACRFCEFNQTEYCSQGVK